MELKIENNVFFILEAGEAKSVFDTEEAAVSALKSLIATKPDLDVEKDAVIMAVDISTEKWSIKQVSWSRLFAALLRGA